MLREDVIFMSWRVSWGGLVLHVPGVSLHLLQLRPDLPTKEGHLDLSSAFELGAVKDTKGRE